MRSAISMKRSGEPGASVRSHGGRRLKVGLTALALAAGFAAAGASVGQAKTVTLTMDEVPIQGIDGLTVSKGFEKFTFSDPGGQLLYNGGGVGQETYVQDPGIGGPAEFFSVSFSVPVDKISFGLAAFEQTGIPCPVLLDFNAPPFEEQTGLNLTLNDPFPEGEFTWSASGGPPATGFTVQAPASYFLIDFDNLTVSAGVPEPAAWAMMLVGIGGIGAATRLWRRNQRGAVTLA